METYKKGWKILIRNPMLLGTVILYFLGCAVFIFKDHQYEMLYKNSLGTLRETLEYAMVPYALFMCIGYEIAVKMQESNLAETVSVYKSGLLRVYGGWALLLVTLAFINYALPMGQVLLIYQVQGSQSGLLVRHLLLCGLLYHFVTPCVGGAIGLMLAVWLKKRRILVYSVVLILTLLTTNYVAPILFIPFNITGQTAGPDLLYWLKDLFTLTPYGLEPTALPDILYGLPMEPARWLLALFWLSGAVLVLIRNAVPQSKRRCVLLASCLAISLASFVGWAMRGSVLIEDSRPSAAGIYDQLHYIDTPYEEVKPAFSVLSYDLDLCLYRELSATVRMELSAAQDDRDYQFTLYHRFHIGAIQDEQGRDVRFTREGDQFSITQADMPLNRKITVQYTGFSPKFYSNAQGVSLPGYFPYYPIAGVRSIYSNDVLSGYDTRPDTHEHMFWVQIRAPYPVYCNLNGSGNCYEGVSTNLSLFGGLMEPIHNGPWTLYVESQNRNKRLDEVLIQQQAVYDRACQRLGRESRLDVTQKNVFFLPVYFGFGSNGEKLEDMGDHWLIKQEMVDAEMLAEEMLKRPWNDRDGHQDLCDALCVYLREGSGNTEQNVDPHEILLDLQTLYELNVKDPVVNSIDSADPTVQAAFAFLEKAQTSTYFPLQKLDAFLCSDKEDNPLGVLINLVKEAMNHDA